MDKGVGKHQKVRPVAAKTEIRDKSTLVYIESRPLRVSNGNNFMDIKAGYLTGFEKPGMRNVRRTTETRMV